MSDPQLLGFQFEEDEKIWPLHTTTVPLVNELRAREATLSRQVEELREALEEMLAVHFYVKGTRKCLAAERARQALKSVSDGE